MVQPRATPPLVPPEPAGGGGGCSAGRVGRERDGVGLGEVGGAADGAPLAVSCPGWRAVAATRSPAWSAARARARPKPRRNLPPPQCCPRSQQPSRLSSRRFASTSSPPASSTPRCLHRCSETGSRSDAMSCGNVILPGVVTHSANVVEHPGLVADRMVRFAEAVSRENVLASTDMRPRRPGPPADRLGEAGHPRHGRRTGHEQALGLEPPWSVRDKGTRTREPQRDRARGRAESRRVCAVPTRGTVSA